MSEEQRCPYCGSDCSLPRPQRCAACRRLCVVENRYEVISLLGKGGTSAVYRGRDRVTSTDVAIKVVPLQDWKLRELFERGHAILRALDHPGVPRAFAFVSDGGDTFQVRELYAGGSLEALLASGFRFNRRQVHYFLRDMLGVLEHLHGMHPPVIHRDVKPANIMLRDLSQLSPALVDFDAAASESKGTGTTIVVSPGYTAPEQLIGDERPASDLYGLGMTVLNVLTHKQPMELPRKDGVLQVDDVLQSLEPATRHVMTRLIRTNVSERYTSAADALRELSGNIALQPTKQIGSAHMLTKPIVMFGASLFRIAVGLLLGLLLSYVGLIVWQSL